MKSWTITNYAVEKILLLFMLRFRLFIHFLLYYNFYLFYSYLSCFYSSFSCFDSFNSYFWRPLHISIYFKQIKNIIKYISTKQIYMLFLNFGLIFGIVSIFCCSCRFLLNFQHTHTHIYILAHGLRQYSFLWYLHCEEQKITQM